MQNGFDSRGNMLDLAWGKADGWLSVYWPGSNESLDAQSGGLGGLWVGREACRLSACPSRVRDPDVRQPRTFGPHDGTDQQH